MKPDEREVFKVTEVRGKKRMSLMCSSASVEYQPGIAVSPKFGAGPLTCFDTYKNAEAFFYTTGERSVQIWRAIGSYFLTEKDTTPLYYSFPDTMRNGELFVFLTTVENLPRGTLRCFKIELVELIFDGHCYSSTEKILVLKDGRLSKA